MTPAFYPATYWGGPIASVYGLCKALASRPDTQVTVLTTDAAGPRLHQRIAPEARLAASATGFETHYCRRIAANAISAELLVRLGGLVAAADVVHLTGVYSATTFPTLAACKAHGKPLVWSPRGSWQSWPGKTRATLKRAWDALAFTLVTARRTAIHVTSEAEAAAVDRRDAVSAVACIPNAVDIPPALGARDWVPDGTIRLLFVGRVHPIKGLDVLMRALALCDTSRFTLRIAGTGDPGYMQELQRLSAELGVDSRVTWMGHLDDAAKRVAYAEADVVAVPSHSENFGMTVAEALAHGVPVVAGTGTPWSQLVEQGCGWWVDPDAQRLAEVLRGLSSAPLASMGEKGRRWIDSEYSWIHVAERMSALYGSLVHG